MTTPPGQSPAAAQIERDLPCAARAYNLRTQLESGRCPECGLPVWRTLLGNTLVFSEGRWVGALAAGLWLMTGGAVTWLLLEYVGAQGPAISVGTARLLSAVRLVLALAGVWMVTEPEPSPLLGEWVFSLRRIVRWLSLAAGALYMLTPYLAARTAGSSLAEGAKSHWTSAAFAVSLLGFGLFFLLTLHVAALCRRLPRRGLALLWIALGAIAFLSAAGCIGPSILATNLRPGGGEMAAVVLVFVQAMVALLIIVLMIMTAWRFTVVARQAVR